MTTFYFLREQVSRGQIELLYCRIEDQIIDILTKLMKVETFERLRSMMRVTSFKNLN